MGRWDEIRNECETEDAALRRKEIKTQRARLLEWIKEAEVCEGMYGPCLELGTAWHTPQTAYPDDGGPKDPNRPRWLCDACGEAQYDYWEGMWQDYWSSVL